MSLREPILTYERNPPGMLRTSRSLPVRSGFLLPAALQLELFEQPASFTEFFSTLLVPLSLNLFSLRRLRLQRFPTGIAGRKLPGHRLQTRQCRRHGLTRLLIESCLADPGVELRLLGL